MRQSASLWRMVAQASLPHGSCPCLVPFIPPAGSPHSWHLLVKLVPLVISPQDHDGSPWGLYKAQLWERVLGVQVSVPVTCRVPN